MSTELQSLKDLLDKATDVHAEILHLTGGEAALLKSRVAELTAERDALKTANADLSQYAAMVKAERDALMRKIYPANSSRGTGE